MSFGTGAQGEIKYRVTVDAADATAKLQSTGQAVQQLGQTTQSSAQQMQALPQTYQTIVQEGDKVTKTTREVQQTMQGTVTTVTTATNTQKGFGSVLKDNIFAISTAASSIIGLVHQYTSLQRAQLTVNRVALLEEKQRAKLITLTQKHQDMVKLYGQNSKEATKAEHDMVIMEQQLGITIQRHEILQQQLNERVAEFAVNILPNLIGAGGSIAQVVLGIKQWRQQTQLQTVTTIESTGAVEANAAGMLLQKGAATGVVPALKGVQGAEIGVGAAAKGMGISMKAALIGTGIGTVLVLLGSLLAAYAANWLGLRDAINEAGAAIGAAFPKLKPLLDVLTNVGKMLTGDFTSGTESAATGMDKMADSGKEAQQALDTVSQSVAGFMNSLAGLDKKGRKKFVFDLGLKGDFGKDFAKKIENTIQPAIEHLSAFGQLTTAFQGGIFDALDLRKKGFLKKLASTWESRFDEIANDLDIDKHIFDPITNVIKNSKGKTDKEIAVAIAHAVIDNPQIAAAFQLYGIDTKVYEDIIKADDVTKGAQKSIDEGFGNIDLGGAIGKIPIEPSGPASAIWQLKMDQLMDQEVQNIFGKDKKKTAQEKAKDNARLLGIAVREGFNEGLAGIGQFIGVTAEGVLDVTFAGLFDKTPADVLSDIQQEIQNAINVAPSPFIAFLDWLMPSSTSGDVFGGVELDTRIREVIATVVSSIADPMAWRNLFAANKAMFDSIVGALGEFIAAAVPNATSILTNIATQFGNLLGDAGMEFRSAFASITPFFDEVASAFGEFIAAGIQNSTDILTNISTAFANVFSGKFSLDDMLKGIEVSLSGIEDWAIKNVVNPMIDAINEGLKAINAGLPDFLGWDITLLPHIETKTPTQKAIDDWAAKELKDLTTTIPNVTIKPTDYVVNVSDVPPANYSFVGLELFTPKSLAGQAQGSLGGALTDYLIRQLAASGIVVPPALKSGNATVDEIIAFVQDPYSYFKSHGGAPYQVQPITMNTVSVVDQAAQDTKNMLTNMMRSPLLAQMQQQMAGAGQFEPMIEEAGNASKGVQTVFSTMYTALQGIFTGVTKLWSSAGTTMNKSSQMVLNNSLKHFNRLFDDIAGLMTMLTKFWSKSGTTLNKTSQMVLNNSLKHFNRLFDDIAGLMTLVTKHWSKAGTTLNKTSQMVLKNSLKHFNTLFDDIAGLMTMLTKHWSKAGTTMNKTSQMVLKNSLKHFNTLMEDIAGKMNDLAKHWSNPVCSSIIANAKSTASQVNKALDGIKDQEVTISVGVVGAGASFIGGGGTFKLAKGGVISSAAKGFTTNGPQLLMIGDNPGGRETVAVIPRDNPQPTMRLLERQMFGESRGNSGSIVVNLTNVLNDRQITRTFRREIGKDMYRFGP